MSPRQRAALREAFGVKQALTSGWGGEVGHGEGNWTSSTSVCSRSTVQSPAVSLPVTVVMWLEESEVLLWKRLVPVQ